MHAIYNGKLILEKEFTVDNTNRAFQYGDGLFETIIVLNGNIQLLHYHFDRLTKGLKVFEIEHDFDYQRLENQIEQLLKVNNFLNTRIKLQIWRSSGGFFTPTKHTAEFLISSSEYSPQQKLIKKAGFAKTIFITQSPFSKFKTSNSLPYILAGIEKKNRNLDEIILLNNDGFICECVASNIFWYTDGAYFTPSLETGCVDGTMRRHLITTAAKYNIIIKTGKFIKEELLEAESVFTSNATGCFAIQSINNTPFKVRSLKFDTLNT